MNNMGLLVKDATWSAYGRAAGMAHRQGQGHTRRPPLLLTTHQPTPAAGALPFGALLGNVTYRALMGAPHQPNHWLPSQEDE